MIGAIALEELLDFTGRLAAIFAYALGAVTTAKSVGTLQPFVIMIYISILGAFVPGALDEELDWKLVLPKISAVAFIVLGIYLIY